MSVAGKMAKTTLSILSIFVFLVIGMAIYLYVNMDSIAKQFAEASASQSLGVTVTIGSMDINLEERKVLLNDINISNPTGYKKPQAIHIDKIVVAGEEFTKDLLTLTRVEVEGTNVNLEVRPQGTNLGELKKNVEAQSADSAPQSTLKAIVRDVVIPKAQLNPSVVLIDKNLAFVNVPDIHVTGIGEKENGVSPQDAIGQVMAVVLQELNRSANSAGFLEGLPLDVLNDIGVSTLDVFNKNLQQNAQKKVDELSAGAAALKNMFAK